MQENYGNRKVSSTNVPKDYSLKQLHRAIWKWSALENKQYGKFYDNPQVIIMAESQADRLI